MNQSLFASVRAALAPLDAFDWPQLFGAARARTRWDANCALSAERIDLRAGEFRLAAHRVAFRRGAVTAIVGPNGAGKSTLLETLLGFRRGAGERLRILDIPAVSFMSDNASLRRLGAQLQRVEYPDHAQVSEIVALHRALYREQDPLVAAALGLDELRRKPYRGLSKGQRQRVDLYVALAHRPEIIVLDEPFTGLDKHYAGVVAEMLRARSNGASVAMICHSAEELATVDDIVWVADGGIRYQGTRQALRERLVGKSRALMHCNDEAQAAVLRQHVEILPGVQRVAMPQPLQVEVFGNDALHALVQEPIATFGIRHVELAPSTDSDLLRVCARGNHHA
jgi:ABC-2 type transport system ATP-binding protein